MKINETFIRLGYRIPSVLYEAEGLSEVFVEVSSGVSAKASIEKSRTAILVMHSDEDYLTFEFGKEMAKRGYRVLCANVASRYDSLDQKMLNLKLAVRKLRECPDVSKVVLMGHSGGGTLMTAYQNIAENGVKTFQGSEKLVRCSDDLADLPPADGIMLLDSNFGIAAMALFSLDPAITDEGDAQHLNEELNLWNPANGFRADGSVYSDEFIKKFQKAQGERNKRLIKTALVRIAVIESGKGNYADDEPFIVPGAEQAFFNNKLYAQDIRLLSHTKKEWPLLKGDGSTSKEIVRSVRKPENSESFTRSYHDGALITTVRNYLSSYAVRTQDDYGYNEDSVYGIDWSSSYNCPPGNIRKVTVPLLIMGMTGNWEYLASETIYENAASRDKTIVFVEGASHRFTTATHCEKFPGEFGDTLKTTCDYVDTWLSQEVRFV
jgi:pimeloyl-ACP methyl ester carboxylesterase